MFGNFRGEIFINLFVFYFSFIKKKVYSFGKKKSIFCEDEMTMIMIIIVILTSKSDMKDRERDNTKKR